MLLAGVKKEMDFNVFFVSLMLLVYAFLSSSTPDAIGPPEALIALILVGLTFTNFLKITDIDSNLKLFGTFYIFFLYMLIVPTFAGLVLKVNTFNDFIRDFIPFLYFALPVFFMPFMIKNSSLWIYLLSSLMLVVAASFSVRHFMDAAMDLSLFGEQVFYGGMNYFPMDPAVIFGATFGVLMGLELLLFQKKKNLKSMSVGLLALALGLLAYASIISIMVRAQIALVLLSLFVYLVIRSWKNPAIVFLIFLPAIGIFVYYILDFLDAVYILMQNKSERVGVSGRDMEVLAILDNSALSYANLFFGEGWGGLVSNPTGGGAEFRFVHNAGLYFLFKAGLPGILIGTIVFFYFFYYLVKYFTEKLNTPYLIILLAIFNAIVLNVTLEPGYKMMSFGVILTIFFLIHYREKFKRRML